jgi:hypothetical protein
VFGWTWPRRPAWLAQLTALAAPVLLVPAVIIALFPAGFVHASLAAALNPVGVVLELLVLVVLLRGVPAVIVPAP